MRIGVIAAALCCAAAFAGAAQADPQADWLKARQAEFATWQAAHPDVEAQVAYLKVKTAAMVEAYRNRPRPPRYADLISRAAAASPEDKQAARNAFHAGLALWKSGDFPSAEAAFKLGLDLEPTNGMADFYYGDCLQRRGDAAGAGDYMARAMFFGGQSPEAFKAQAALASLPAPADPDISLPPAIFKVSADITEIWDAPDAPKMVVIPAGAYTMGSPASEQSRAVDGLAANEGPQHRVTIGYPLAVGKYDITRGEFAAFVTAAGYVANGCAASGKDTSSSANWQRPGFNQTGNDPVVCVNFDDAQAYASWLSQKTGHAYRLLSESEYEYATRAGTTTTFWWGNDLGVNNANCNGCGGRWDGRQTSPVGSFLANPFGLYDMSGDASSWTADCFNYQDNGVTTDGSTWASANCDQRALRGGSWDLYGAFVQSALGLYYDHATRPGYGLDPKWRENDVGFRIARIL